MKMKNKIKSTVNDLDNNTAITISRPQNGSRKRTLYRVYTREFNEVPSTRYLPIYTN